MSSWRYSVDFFPLGAIQICFLKKNSQTKISKRNPDFLVQQEWTKIPPKIIQKKKSWIYFVDLFRWWQLKADSYHLQCSYKRAKILSIDVMFNLYKANYHFCNNSVELGVKQTFKCCTYQERCTNEFSIMFFLLLRRVKRDTY